MRFSITFILLAILTLGALASPTRNMTSPAWGGSGFIPPDSCQGRMRFFYTRWDILVKDDIVYNNPCGASCLESIRGHNRHSVTDWGCKINSDGYALYTFNTDIFATEYAMHDALAACLGGRQILCQLL